MEFLRQHGLAVLLSALLHTVLAVALTVGLDLPARQRPRAPVEQVAIEATVVDETLIRKEMARLEALEQEEVRRRLEQAEEARRQLEQEQRRLEVARAEREEVERQEQRRLTALEQQRVAEERAAREAEQQRLTEERRLEQLRAEEERRLEQLRAEEERRLEQLRVEEERRRQEELERQRQAAEAARRQAEREAELARALAAEEEARRAERARLLDDYIRLIENRIQQNWIRPASAQEGLICTVSVTQIPSGDVVDVRIGQCNGDEAVVRSIEAAVRRSSPLPRPPIPALFERNLEVVFRPDV